MYTITHVHALLSSLGLFAGTVVAALVTLRLLEARYRATWVATELALPSAAPGYRVAARVASSTSGHAPREVRLAAFAAMVAGLYALVTEVDFARIALGTDLFHWFPSVVRLGVVSAVFVVPTAVLMVRASVAMIRREPGAVRRVRATAGIAISLRAMQVIGAVATMSYLLGGKIAWRVALDALPGLPVLAVVLAFLLRGARALERLPAPVVAP